LDALWERLDLDGMTVDVECARRAVGVVQRLGKGQAKPVVPRPIPTRSCREVCW
jgi:hypothetical protein